MLKVKESIFKVRDILVNLDISHNFIVLFS